MLKMRYKSFTWPHNPKTYTISCERRTVVQKIPLGGFVVQDLGQTCTVMRGEGEFYGAGAYQSFQALLSVFEQKGEGVLAHPAWSCAGAWFTRLQLTQEPREDYVAYQFEFCEAEPNTRAYEAEQAADGPNVRQYHTVESGQTLWDLSSLYGRSMTELTRLNPGIARPNNLTTGQKVRLT